MSKPINYSNDPLGDLHVLNVPQENGPLTLFLKRSLTTVVGGRSVRRVRPVLACPGGCVG